MNGLDKLTFEQLRPEGTSYLVVSRRDELLTVRASNEQTEVEIDLSRVQSIALARMIKEWVGIETIDYPPDIETKVKHISEGWWQREIFEAVRREREYQDKNWGTIDLHPHTVFEWIGIMEHELAEAKEAFFQRHAHSEMLKEILHVVAVGFSCLEQHGFRERKEIRDDNS